MDIGFDATIPPASAPRIQEPAPQRLETETEPPVRDTVEVSERSRETASAETRERGPEMTTAEADRAVERVLLEAQLGLSAHSRIDESAVVHLLGT